MKATITTPVHECVSADTTSATITFDAIDISICAFDRSLASARKVKAISEAIAAILSLQD